MLRVIIGVTLVALLASPVLAQSPDTEPAGSEGEEAQEEGRSFEDRIVVTASRQEQESSRTPVPITVIDRIQIEQAQPEKLADLFKQIPGVEVSGEGPFRGLPVIRGFSSNRVLILVDGQRLNNARESTVFAGIQPGLVDLNQVERIEVLRGPASVLYGSDAMGGVINIITRAPQLGAEGFDWHGSASYEYGENADSQRARISFQGAGEGFSLQVSGGYQDVGDYYAPEEAFTDERFSDYVDDEGRVFNSGMTQTSFNGNLRWTVGSQGVLKVGAEVVRTEDIGFPGFDPASGIDISFPNFDRDKLSAAWDSGPVGGLANIGLSAYYQKTRKESRRNLDFGPYFFLFNTTTSDIDSFGFNAQSVADLGTSHVTFGLDFYRDSVDDDTIAEDPWTGVNTDVAVPRSYQTGLGVYVQDEVQATDKLLVLAGLRYDTFDFKSQDDPDYHGEPFDVTDSDLSGNVGLVYSVTQNVQLTGLIGRGFRTPNLQERAYYGGATEPGYFIVQNPELTSERSLNYEAGFKVRYDRYFGGLNVFYNDVRDLITFVEIGEDELTGDTLIQYDNIDEATIKGIELELQTLFGDSWTLFTNASYTRGENDTENQPLGFIPPVKLVVGLRYQQERWWGEAAARFVGKQDRLPDNEDGDESIGDFTSVDLRGGYEFAFGLGIKGAVGNLLDELYAEPFNNRPEPGRSYRVAVSYKF